MKSIRSVWTTLTGGLASGAPVLLACCKSGACVGVCASPLASLFGISSASLAASPYMVVLEPALIAVSAVAFTVSYYSLYVLPAKAAAAGACCGPAPAESRKTRISKTVFWLGLFLSLGFLGYFQYDKFQNAQNSGYAAAACGPDGCEEGTEGCAESEDESACCDTAAADAGPGALTCKLGSSELQERRETVIAELKSLLLEKKELGNGFAFKFENTAPVMEKLNEFIRSESECCDFFRFRLDLEAAEKEVWLSLTGEAGVKDFIGAQLGL